MTTFAWVAAIVVSLPTARIAYAETCTPGGLGNAIGPPTINGVDWDILYSVDDWEDCGDSGDYFSTTWANKIAGIIAISENRHDGD